MTQLPEWVLTGYSLNPWVLTALFGPLLRYSIGGTRLWLRAGLGKGISRTQSAASTLGIITLGVALLSPLDYVATMLFSAHMLQHMLLAFVAAPLLAWSEAGLAFLWAVPARQRVTLSRRWLASGPPRQGGAGRTAAVRGPVRCAV